MCGVPVPTSAALLTLPVPPFVSIAPPDGRPYLISGTYLYSDARRWLRVLFPSALHHSPRGVIQQASCDRIMDLIRKAVKQA
jgi:hypothetical protein